MKLARAFIHCRLQKVKNGRFSPVINVPLCVFVCQREGALDDDSADMDGENGRGFEEYEWAGQKRIRATALLEGGFRGTNTVIASFSFPSLSKAALFSVCVCVVQVSTHLLVR